MTMRARAPLGNVVYIEVTEDIAVFLPLLFLNRRTLKPTEVNLSFAIYGSSRNKYMNKNVSFNSVNSLARGGGSVIIT